MLKAWPENLNCRKPLNIEYFLTPTDITLLWLKRVTQYGIREFLHLEQYLMSVRWVTYNANPRAHKAGSTGGKAFHTLSVGRFGRHFLASVRIRDDLREIGVALVPAELRF
jgi:hypothetical protein